MNVRIGLFSFSADDGRVFKPLAGDGEELRSLDPLGILEEIVDS